MVRSIKLCGWLGRKFGKEYFFDVESAAEAVRALCLQVDGFKDYLSQGGGKEKLFKVVVNNNTLIDPEKSMLMESLGEIKIVPVIRASGGAFNFIAGAVLTVVGFFTSPYVIAVGVGMMLGGAAAMLVKPPKQQQPSEQKQDRSYIFNGAVNVTQQGQPVPVGYGRMMIGSQVISASVSSCDI